MRRDADLLTRLIAAGLTVGWLAVVYHVASTVRDARAATADPDLSDALALAHVLLVATALIIPIAIFVGMSLLRRWEARRIIERVRAEFQGRPPTARPSPPVVGPLDPRLGDADSSLSQSVDIHPAGVEARRWAAMMRHSPLAIAVFDRELRYIAHSHRWLEAYRIEEPSLVGRLHYDVFPEIPGRWRVIHQMCLEGATKHSDGEAFPRADGRVDWLRYEVRPWYDDDDHIGGLIMMTDVITAQKEAEQALAARVEELEAAHAELVELHGQLAAAAQVTDLGHWTWWPATGEMAWSDAVYRIFGVEPGEVTPHIDVVRAHIQPEHRELHRARLRRIVSHSAEFKHRSPIVRADGRERIVHLAGRVERDQSGQPERVFGAIMDITEHVEAERTSNAPPAVAPLRRS